MAGGSPLAIEPGTFALPVLSSDGSEHVAMGVMLVNSGDYAGNPERMTPSTRGMWRIRADST